MSLYMTIAGGISGRYSMTISAAFAALSPTQRAGGAPSAFLSNHETWNAWVTSSRVSALFEATSGAAAKRAIGFWAVRAPTDIS
jgi:hypothetical protein